MYKWKVEVEGNTRLSFWRKKVKRTYDKFALDELLSTVFFAARIGRRKIIATLLLMLERHSGVCEEMFGVNSKIAQTTQSIWKISLSESRFYKKLQTMAIIREISDSNLEAGRNSSKPGVSRIIRESELTALSWTPRKTQLFWSRQLQLMLEYQFRYHCLFDTFQAVCRAYSRNFFIIHEFFGQSKVLFIAV